MRFALGSWFGGEDFWKQAFTYTGSVTPKVLPRVIVFGCFSILVKLLHDYDERLAIGIGPLEVSGAAIGVLMVLRVNAGYDRWWEARKLWGGIVNQTRNLVISVLAYGPSDPAWRGRFVRLAASFPFVAKSSLRGERHLPEVVELLGSAQSQAIVSAQHMPSYLALLLAGDLRIARTRYGMDGFSFLQIDKERTQLIDYIGASERILKTPIPLICAIKVRRFIMLYLALLPFALAGRIEWLTPFVQVFVAYPLLSLDQIGEELQNPFWKQNLSHLPLDGIASTISDNALALEKSQRVMDGSVDEVSTAFVSPSQLTV